VKWGELKTKVQVLVRRGSLPRTPCSLLISAARETMGRRHRGVPRSLRLAKAYSRADLKIRKYEVEMRHKLLMRWRPLLVTRLSKVSDMSFSTNQQIRSPNPKSKLLIKSLNTSPFHSSLVLIVEALMISIIFASFQPLPSSSASPTGPS
jgi:hypothetical protein